MEKPPLYVARRYTVTPSSGDGIDELRKAFRTTNELRVVWTLPELALRRCAALEERARNSLADLEIGRAHV